MSDSDLLPDDRAQLEDEQLHGDDVPDDESGPASETEVRTKFEEGPDGPSAQSTGITGGR